VPEKKKGKESHELHCSSEEEGRKRSVIGVGAMPPVPLSKGKKPPIIAGKQGKGKRTFSSSTESGGGKKKNRSDSLRLLF